jgi:AcrR family transcriptional regulator
VAGATTRRIAAEARVSLATLHYVFKAKDDILAAVLESLIDRASEGNSVIAAHLVTPPGASPPGLAELIHRLVGIAWDLVRGDLVTQRVQYEFTLYALRTPEAAHLGRALRGYHLSAIEEIIHQTLKHAGRTTRCPPRDLAHLINCAVDGILLDYLVDPDPDQADRSLAQLADAILTLATTPRSTTADHLPASVPPAND